MQSTQMMSPGSHPAVPGASPNASSHILGLCPKWSIDLDAASLDVESSTVTIDDAYSPSLETRNIFATLRSKRISDFVSGGGTADHLTGSPLTN